MPTVNFTLQERNAIRDVVELVQNVGSNERDLLLDQVPRGNEGVIRRFVRGAYSHPLTWWVGVFQLQMQIGMWGARHRAAATMRANGVAAALQVVWYEAVSLATGGNAPVLTGVVAYSLGYKKANMLGRLAGGEFTNLASAGGRFGVRRLSTMFRRGQGLTNFVIASYGAAVKGVAMGYRTSDALVHAILTGQPAQLPPEYFQVPEGTLGSEELELRSNLGERVGETIKLTEVGSGSVPIEEFCARPENASLTSVCQ